jgi:hypothetical protein
MVEEKEETVAAAEQEEKNLSELAAPCWSVVSFETTAASGLTYDEASKMLKELNKQKIAGLCIVTDESASRIKQ